MTYLLVAWLLIGNQLVFDRGEMDTLAQCKRVGVEFVSQGVMGGFRCIPQHAV